MLHITHMLHIHAAGAVQCGGRGAAAGPARELFSALPPACGGLLGAGTRREVRKVLRFATVLLRAGRHLPAAMLGREVRFQNCGLAPRPDYRVSQMYNTPVLRGSFLLGTELMFQRPSLRSRHVSTSFDTGNELWCRRPTFDELRQELSSMLEEERGARAAAAHCDAAAPGKMPPPPAAGGASPPQSQAAADASSATLPGAVAAPAASAAGATAGAGTPATNAVPGGDYQGRRRSLQGRSASQQLPDRRLLLRCVCNAVTSKQRSRSGDCDFFGPFSSLIFLLRLDFMSMTASALTFIVCLWATHTFTFRIYTQHVGASCLLQGQCSESCCALSQYPKSWTCRPLLAHRQVDIRLMYMNFFVLKIGSITKPSILAFRLRRSSLEYRRARSAAQKTLLLSAPSRQDSTLRLAGHRLRTGAETGVNRRPS